MCSKRSIAFHNNLSINHDGFQKPSRILHTMNLALSSTGRVQKLPTFRHRANPPLHLRLALYNSQEAQQVS